MVGSKAIIGIVVVAVLIIGGIWVFSSGDVDSDNREVIGSDTSLNNVENNDDNEVVVGDNNNLGDDVDINDNGEIDWREVELRDVNTGETFMVNDFLGKPVLLESFAVWCPTCTSQQRITKEYHEEVGDSVISIALDTDPNEDESKVKEHTARHGFDWRYAVAPAEMTQDLIDEFGVGIVSAPSVPMILICEDGSAEKLASGIKDIDELKEAVASC